MSIATQIQRLLNAKSAIKSSITNKSVTVGETVMLDSYHTYIPESKYPIVVLNIEEGIIEQDKHIAGYAVEAGKAVVIVVNKWDTVKDPNVKEYEKIVNYFKQFYAQLKT